MLRPNDPTIPPMLLTRRQAAQTLALSIDCIDQLIQRNELEAVRIGRAVRIPTESCRAFIDQKRAAGALAVAVEVVT